MSEPERQENRGDHLIFGYFYSNFQKGLEFGRFSAASQRSTARFAVHTNAMLPNFVAFGNVRCMALSVWG